MRKIYLDNPHRKKHFDFFNAMSQPHFNICFEVNISRFYTAIKENKLVFNSSMVYILSRVANETEKFRHRVREDHILVHDVIHPSYSIPTRASEVFSFCTVAFDPDFTVFVNNSKKREAELQKNPSFEDEKGRDDFLFLSAIPWIPFTSFKHAMHVPNRDSVPRIVWGKFIKKQDQLWMPISVQLHHSVADGKDLGEYYEKLQQYLDHFEQLI